MSQPLVGVTVRVGGLGETMTSQAGTFSLEAPDTTTLRRITLSSSSTVERVTTVVGRPPGSSPLTYPLMPTTFNLSAFQQMFRGNESRLQRWVEAPAILIERRLLQFTTIGDVSLISRSTVMSETEAALLLADLQSGLGQLTAGSFAAFEGQAIETSPEGIGVPMHRQGIITVARVSGLRSATGFIGYGYWWWNGIGEINAGFIMLDVDADSSSASGRSLRFHELGHALGYNHVTGVGSIMNTPHPLQLTPFDLDAAKLAYQRVPLNRHPDTDPEPAATVARDREKTRMSGAP